MSKEIIIVVEVPRSGAGMIAGCLKLAGAISGQTDRLNRDIEVCKVLDTLLSQLKADRSGLFPLPAEKRTKSYSKNKMRSMLLTAMNYKSGQIHFLYDYRFLLTWRIWNNYFPDAKWIMVRRNEQEIVESCKKTGWMDRFGDEAGWYWLIDQYLMQYNQMRQNVKNLTVVHPERMITEDYSEMQKTIEWAGLQWTDDIHRYMDMKLKKRKELK